MDRVHVRLPPHVAVRRLDGETVLLNLQTGAYHGLDAVGTDFLSALEDHETVEAAADDLAGRYEVSTERVRKDIQRFCEGMRERGLMELSGDRRI